MQFDELGNMNGKTLMLLPGTACDYQTNFMTVLDRLGEKYHLICVNYDGFDGSGSVFPDMITVTEKIEKYIKEHFDGRIDGAIGSSLGSSFVGQLIQRENVHMDHGIFGSPDLDQSGRFSAWLQSKLVVPLLTSFTKNEKKRAKLKEKLKAVFEMNDETADRFIGCLSIFDPVTIKTNTIPICSPGFGMTSMWNTLRFISYMPIRWERNISNGIKSIFVIPIS